MKSIDGLAVSGQLDIHVWDFATGITKEFRQEKNLVLLLGKDFITSRMIGVAQAVISHMGVGTSGTAAATGNNEASCVATMIGSKVALSPAAAQGTTVSANDNVTYQCTFAPGVGTGAIQEAFLFNSGTNAVGIAFARTVFGTVTKAAGDSMAITWKINFTAA
jgi:hypothetical protein